MEFSVPITLETPRGTLTFNDFDAADYYYLEALDGLDSPAVRSSVEPLPQRDGASMGASFHGARYPLLRGQIVHTTEASRRASEDDLRAYLFSILRADGILRWLPSGQVAAWTNLIRNGGIETNATDWAALTGTETVTRTTTQAYYGYAALKVDLPAASGSQGVYAPFSVTHSNTYTVSVWFKGVASSGYTIQITNQAGTQRATADFTGTGGWQQVTLTAATVGGDTGFNLIVRRQTRAGAETFYLDAAQAELGSSASPYGHTDGAIQTHSGTRRTTVREMTEPVIGGAYMKTFSLPLVSPSGLVVADAELTHDSGALSGGVASKLVFNGGTAQPPLYPSGSAPAWPTVRLYGPVTNPIAKNNTTGLLVALTYVVAAGDYVEIVMTPGAETVKLDDGTDLTSTINFATSTFWPLEPGLNQVQMLGSAGDGNELIRVVFREGFA